LLSVDVEDYVLSSVFRHRPHASADTKNSKVIKGAKLTKLKVTWHCSHSAIPENIWRECFSEDLEGKFWYQTLEESALEKQFQFFYAVVQTDKPIAIAPCFLMDVPMELLVPDNLISVFRALGAVVREFKSQRTFFIGSPCADEGTVAISEGYELSDILDALHKAVDAKAKSLKAPMIVWKDFPEHFWTALSKLCKNHGFFQIESFPGATVELTKGADVETYYQQLKASRRQKIKKKLRVSEAAVKLDSEVLQAPDVSLQEEILPLFWQTYEKGKTKFEKLTPQFFSKIAEAKEAWFILLREHETQALVAFMLCFKLKNIVINKFIGLDYKRPSDWFLYFRLWHEAIKFCVSQKVGELQSGQTGYSAKIELGHKLVPLKNFCRHSNFILNRIYAEVAKTVSWATLDEDLAVYVKKYPSEEVVPK
jgi:hypothetical protein